MALGLGPEKPEGKASPKGKPPIDAAPEPMRPPAPAREATQGPEGLLARGGALEAVADRIQGVATAAAPPGGPVPRRSGIGATVALYVASAILLWAAVAWLLNRYASRPWDFTSQRVFTLEEETRGLLKRVNQPVKLTALFGRTGELRLQVLDELESLVDLMRIESRNIEYRRIDPDRDPAATYELISRLKIENDPARYRDGLVVEYAGKATLIPITKISQIELTKVGSQTIPKEKAFQGEYAIATALLNLLEDHHAKVYMTAGHGELDPDNPDRDGFQYARAALREEKTDVEPLYLLENERVPEDASAVIVAGPTEPFATSEVVKLSNFLESGGGLFLTLGPQRFSGLESLLARFGVEFGRDLVVDPLNKRAARSPADLIVKKLGNHPIVNSLTTSTIEVSNCRSIRRIENAAALHPKLLRTELLWSSEKSWAETDLTQSRFVRNPEAGDINGPVALGMALHIPPDPNDPKSLSRGGIRMVLFGSRELFTNFWLVRSPANSDLFQNSIHWLAKRDRLATVRPRSPGVRMLTLTEHQVRRLALAAYGGIPAVFLAFGLLIAWKRRA